MAMVYCRYEPFIDEVIPITISDRTQLKMAYDLLLHTRTPEAIEILNQTIHAIPPIPVSLREDLLYVNVDRRIVPRSRITPPYAIGLVGIAAVLAEMMPALIPPTSRYPLPDSAVVTEVDGEVGIALVFPQHTATDS